MIKPIVMVDRTNSSRLVVEIEARYGFAAALGYHRHKFQRTQQGRLTIWSAPGEYYRTVIRILRDMTEDFVDATGGVFDELSEPSIFDRLARVGIVERTPHQVLHVTTDAPPEVIEAAYKALVKIYHEGSSSGRADPERWQRINDAYTALRR